MKICKIFFIIFFALNNNGYTQTNLESYNSKNNSNDTLTIIELNKAAYNNRLIDSEKTIVLANQALKLSKKLNYINGIGESYRVLGIGKFYLNQIDESIKFYLVSLTFFQKSKNLEGSAKVYNNIGNLYRDINYNKSLDNFKKSLFIAEKLEIPELIAGLYLNIGNVNQRKKNYPLALKYYKQSLSKFKLLNNNIGIIQSQQNLGLIYYNLNNFDVAEKYLIDARKEAQKGNLNNSIASIDLTLSGVYISKEKFDKAESTISEGTSLAKLVKDSKLEYDFLITSYELENKRKNYFQALNYLQKAYKQDSVKYANNISEKISLLETQHIQLEKQKENELTIARQKNTQILFWASSAIAAMAFLVIFLLIKNVRKSANTNKVLTRLNLEISKQKDDLDRANQNLEEIIDDRTKDLKVKNKKLSEYSSHLSHQIRSPVATLKGLMFLEKDNLIEKDEFVEQLGYCINDLDDKIININENLNNPGKSGLVDND
jgi:hypothetical protein